MFTKQAMLFGVGVSSTSEEAGVAQKLILYLFQFLKPVSLPLSPFDFRSALFFSDDPSAIESSDPLIFGSFDPLIP